MLQIKFKLEEVPHSVLIAGIAAVIALVLYFASITCFEVSSEGSKGLSYKVWTCRKLFW